MLSICKVYQEVKRKKKNIFKNELEVKWDIKAAENQPACSSRKAPLRLSAPFTHSLRWLPPLYCPHQGGFCLPAMARPRIYVSIITWRRSDHLTEACKYQKGIICSRVLTHSRQAHASQLLWPNRTFLCSSLGSYNLSGGPVKWLPWQRTLPSPWQAYGKIFNTTRAGGKTERHETDEGVFW